MAAAKTGDRETELRREIAKLGRKRQRALQDARDLLQEIGKLAPEAMQNGVGKKELAELAEISRVTLDQLLKD